MLKCPVCDNIKDFEEKYINSEIPILDGGEPPDLYVDYYVCKKCWGNC